jgi:cell fate regulator YaaT (PSP1 superfamily)
MKKIVGIRFKPAGKIYDFDCGAFVLKQEDHVIVQTEQGFGFGTVIVPPALRDHQPSDRPLKKVFRLASEKDFRQREKNLEAEKNAHSFCNERIEELKLKMNLFSVESSFDASKLTFYFTSEGRVDFRQLVKKLVKKFNLKVEMRQVGIRNQAKMCGGMGRCGRNICCSAFIEKFEPVSIRMAKEQSLSLNPTKISGLCGRLMCCLAYEQETYKELKKGFPKIGKMVMTKNGQGRVLRHNVVNNRATIRHENGQEIEINLEDITSV